MIVAPGTVDLGPFSAPGAVLTPWDVAADALRRTPKYWLSSVRPDGRPHVTPLLATVALDGICFTTGADERKSRNMHGNPQVVITTGVSTLTGTDYVVEGIAALRTDPDELTEAADSFETNLGWHLTDPDGTWHGMGDLIRTGDVELWCVVPTLAFANGDGLRFSQTRYRWERGDRR